jgi:hypothetical protein
MSSLPPPLSPASPPLPNDEQHTSSDDEKKAPQRLCVVCVQRPAVFGPMPCEGPMLSAYGDGVCTCAMPVCAGCRDRYRMTDISGRRCDPGSMLDDGLPRSLYAGMWTTPSGEHRWTRSYVSEAGVEIARALLERRLPDKEGHVLTLADRERINGTTEPDFEERMSRWVTHPRLVALFDNRRLIREYGGNPDRRYPIPIDLVPRWGDSPQQVADILARLLQSQETTKRSKQVKRVKREQQE